MEKLLKSSYPDISEIISAKTIRRQELAALSWEEKVAIILQMQKLLPKGKWKDRVSDTKMNNEQPSEPEFQDADASFCRAIL